MAKASRKQRSGREKTTTSRGKKSQGGEKAGGKTGGKTTKKTTRLLATSRRVDAADPSGRSSSTTRGLGPQAGGQSGDNEGLSRAELADSESVEELLEEGQAFEAGVVSGVENARNADEGGVRTRQVPVDDVPQEYLDED